MLKTIQLGTNNKLPYLCPFNCEQKNELWLFENANNKLFV